MSRKRSLKEGKSRGPPATRSGGYGSLAEAVGASSMLRVWDVRVHLQMLNYRLNGSTVVRVEAQVFRLPVV